MKDFRHFFLIMLYMILIVACNDKVDEKLIEGEWKGAEWLIEGQPGDYDATSALFSFQATGTYSYVYAGAEESGIYHLQNDQLFTTPQGGIKMMVKIEKLTQDSLVINMNRGGTAEKLTLIRK